MLLGQFLLLCALVTLTACGGGGAASSSGSGGSGGSGGGGGGINNGPFTAGKTKYVRTDAVTPYFGWINSLWSLYNPITSQFFVTDPYTNQIFVLNAATEKLVAALRVPGAYSLDDTPDHKTLYVGTLIGDVYTVDPIALTVTKRYIASQIGPNGFQASAAVVLADGNIGLLSEPAGLLASVDGFLDFAIWNPTNNTLDVYTNGACPLLDNFGGFGRTVDRQKIILTSVDSDATLCLFTEATRQAISTTTESALAMYRIVTSPDGKYIALPNTHVGGVDLYSTQDLSKVASVAAGAMTSSALGLFFSADSKTLFAPTDEIVYAYDVQSGLQTGWMPNIFLPPISGGMAVGPIDSASFQSTNGNGLFFGPLEEGVAFLDTATLKNQAVGTQFTNGYLNPATGSINGATAVQLPEANAFGSLSAVYFDQNGATSISATSTTISATTPAGQAGPSDLYVFTSDGGMQLLPEAFSYGPTILQVTPDMTTAEGGAAGIVYGYGFGPPGSGNTIPSTLSITVGGVAAKITGFDASAYDVLGPPFPLQAAGYIIPPGTPGTSVDVQVSTDSGKATLPSAMTYLPEIQQYLSPGVLAQGIYDPHNDLYYFTDTSNIQIFSKTLGAWQTHITIPAPPGMTQRLWGIGLSPDGTKMAIGDLTAQAIYVLNPANPTAIETFSVPTIPNTGPGQITNACGVAISDAGIVYYAAQVQGGTGYNQFFKLDTNTGTVTPYSQLQGGPGTPATDIYLRALISYDNSTAYFNEEGVPFLVDTATDEVHTSTVNAGCCYGTYELTLSADNTQVSSTDYLYDSGLHAQSGLELNDREALNLSYMYGAKLSADGKLLFQPTSLGIDVYDGRLGTLLHRISLPVPLSSTYDALVADGKDNVLIAISGFNGDTASVVDLTSITEPPALPYQLTRHQERGANLSVPNSKNYLRKHFAAPYIMHSPPHLTKPFSQLKNPIK